jgi:hypothetical protein
MAKKKIDISKLEATSPKVIKKPVQAEKAVASIHKSKVTRATVDLDSETHKRLKIRSIESGVSMRELIIQFIHEGLDS